MKVIVFPTKRYSWLQWPVTLKGYDDKAHLTLKYFGEAQIDPRVVASMCDSIAQEFRIRDFIWAPGVFNKTYHVLAFARVPLEIMAAHEKFALIKDQFNPWIPHITVTKEYTRHVELNELTPVDCEMEFSPLELCLGGMNE